MATFNEKGAPTFGKYVGEQDIIMPIFVQSIKFFWSRSSVFALEKQPENLSFQSVFLPFKEVLVAAFMETGAPTSR